MPKRSSRRAVSLPIASALALSGIALLATVSHQRLAAQTSVSSWAPFRFPIRETQWIEDMPSMPPVRETTQPTEHPSMPPSFMTHPPMRPSAPILPSSSSTISVSSTSAPANQCSGNGLQVCRCYCRAELRNCQNNQVSFTSLPLCRDAWSGTTCPSIGFFTTGSDARMCEAQNGQRCEGFIRPGDAPAELVGQKVQGNYLGCGVVGL